jgi:hypothetical protein
MSEYQIELECRIAHLWKSFQQTHDSRIASQVAALEVLANA